MRRIEFTNTQVASSETARDINRGVVLNLIRRRQPISRADLARVSGLQRSTVSLITQQLIRERWVVYGPTGRLPRGRRPTFLRLNERRGILVADLRPAQTTLGVADVNGRLLSQEVMQTPPCPQDTAEHLAARIRRLMQVHRDLVFEGVGISLPGRFNACVLAEVWFGHTETVRDLVVVTISEGVGTGVFMNGQLARGLHGMAGEFGHVSLDPLGPPCSCGGRGCWEVYASNRAALRYYRESSQASEGLSFQDLLTLAEGGDSLALKALDRMAHAIGSGMRMIVASLAPEEIVIVGEFMKHWPRFGPVIEAEVAAGALVGMPPRVRPAAEPGMARLRGTVALVLQKHFGHGVRTAEEERPQAVAL